MSIYKPLSKVTYMLARNEQRAVAFFFVAAAALLAVSYLPEVAAVAHSLFVDESSLKSLSRPVIAVWLEAHWQQGLRSIANFLFSASAVVAVSIAYLRLVGSSLDDMRVRLLYRNHTIICGMSTRSKILARDIIGRRDVVIIDIEDRHLETIDQRVAGISVIHGNAADPKVLARAGIAHASNLVCLTDRDETNIAILEAVRLSIEDRRAIKGVECFCHIQNPSLYAHLEQLPLMDSTSAADRFRLFNTEGITAAELLRRFPPEKHISLESQETDIHVALIGGGNFAFGLAIQMAQQCHYWRQDVNGPAFAPVKLTIVDIQAAVICQQLRWLCPAIDQLLILDALPLAVDSPEVTKLLFLNSEAPVCQLYVSLGDEISTLSVANRFAHAVALAEVKLQPSIVAVTPARLHRIAPEAWNGSTSICIVESYESCKDEVIIGGSRDRMACAAHTRYLEKALEDGEKIHSRQSLYPWDQLGEFLRDSNRQQVAHMDIKLRVLGWETYPHPTAYENAKDLEISDLLLEQLADMEHRRWMAFHLIRGWTYGKTKDSVHHVHDCLLPYSELTESVKEYDRITVRNLASICYAVGLGLRPVH